MCDLLDLTGKNFNISEFSEKDHVKKLTFGRIQKVKPEVYFSELLQCSTNAKDSVDVSFYYFEVICVKVLYFKV